MSYYDELRGQISSLSLNLGEVEYHAARDSLLQMQKYFDEHLLRQLEMKIVRNKGPPTVTEFLLGFIFKTRDCDTDSAHQKINS